MPADTDLAARIEATMARRAKATSVDSISVDKDVLDALYAAWRQLDAMRCETCKHYDAYGLYKGLCLHISSTGAWMAPEDGCRDHEPKEPADTTPNEE